MIFKENFPTSVHQSPKAQKIEKQRNVILFFVSSVNELRLFIASFDSIATDKSSSTCEFLFKHIELFSSFLFLYY